MKPPKTKVQYSASDKEKIKKSIGKLPKDAIPHVAQGMRRPETRGVVTLALLSPKPNDALYRLAMNDLIDELAQPGEGVRIFPTLTEKTSEFIKTGQGVMVDFATVGTMENDLIMEKVANENMTPRDVYRLVLDEISDELEISGVGFAFGDVIGQQVSGLFTKVGR